MYCSQACRSRRHYGNNREAALQASRLRYKANKEVIQEGQRVRRAAIRAKLDAIKLEAGCRICGFNAHPAALEFNHLDPLTKEIKIGQSTDRSWHIVEAEITKCEILCANCHAIHTNENNHYAVRR